MAALRGRVPKILGATSLLAAGGTATYVVREYVEDPSFRHWMRTDMAAASRGIDEQRGATNVRSRVFHTFSVVRAATSVELDREHSVRLALENGRHSTPLGQDLIRLVRVRKNGLT